SRWRRRCFTRVPDQATMPPSIQPTTSAASTAAPLGTETRTKPRSNGTTAALSAPKTTPASTNTRMIRRVIARRMEGLYPMRRATDTPRRRAPVDDVRNAASRRLRDHARCGACSADIDALAQFLAGFEMRHVLARQRHRVAALGVSPHAWRTVVQRETAETADLDAATLC